MSLAYKMKYFGVLFNLFVVTSVAVAFSKGRTNNEIEKLPNGCPVDWRNELLLPHDSDCNKYYHCTHGERVERPCPDGQHFSSEKQWCDWPANAGCEKGPGSGGDSRPSESSSSSSTEETEEKDGDSVERLPNGCPVDWQIEQLLPHDSDCNKYFQCTHGNLVERPCPAGLHFNEKKQECDWPADAGCEKDPGSGGDSRPSESSSSSSTEETEEKDGDSVERLPNGCPVDWQIEQLLPHDSDCNKYFQCTHGNLVERPCPAGLHFNEMKQECDWPADAGCEKDPGSGGDSRPSESSSSSSTEETEEKDGDSVERLPNGCPVDWQIEQLLPHDSDCNKYFQCTHGNLVERPCPAGLHFNEKKQECDWPADAGCEKDPGSGGDSRPSESSSSSSTEETEEKDGDSVERLPNGCPVDWQIEQLLPHDSDCNKYFQCTHGNLVERPCPAGLHFNEKKQECDWPADAGCEKDPGSGGDSRPSESSSSSSTEETEEKDGDSVERLPNGCPVDWQIEQLLPHDSDCNKYFQCTHGNLVERPCPAGLHFNEKKQECDWPADAGCEKDPGSGGDSRPSESSSSSSTEETEEKDGDSVERLPNGCPVDWQIEQLLPHDSDCNKYFQCTHGNLVERPCPAGLHFNEKKQECDWPADAGCEKDPGSGGDSRPSESSSSSSTEETEEKDGDSVERLPNGCPVDWQIEQLLPHDSDCNKYFQCTHGNLVERPCPAGLHFNEKKQECDWPADAGCEKDPGSGGDSRPSESSSSSSTEETEEKDGDSVERLPNGCPVDWQIEQLLPHDSDCNKYFQCTHGNLVERPCPAGLHFNEKKQECDWPADAGCEKDPGSGGDSRPSESSSSSSTEETEEKDGDSVERLPNGCPVDWQIEQLLPHDSDCNKYFQCTHGNLVERPCPAGLHFNEKKQECDWPADAGCEKDPGSGGDSRPSESSSSSSTEETEEKDGDSVERLPNGCPVDWQIEQLLPHDSDCNKYFQCTHGNLVERPCPAGLHFNEMKQECDWPADAGCEKDPGSGDKDGDSVERLPNGCPVDWRIEQLLPHDSDCNKYFQCTHGVLVERPCPAGLHFNEKKQECDWPADAGCEKDPGSGDKDGDSVERLPNGCPVDWRIEQLLPHDSDCNKYFQCTHGVLVERPCPAGLHFNEKKQECDWPADAGCEKDPGSGDKDGDSVERLPNGCPVDWRIEQLLPHDSDCNKYFQCTHGVLVERPCPAGLHFNEKKQECDWPADAGCEKDPGSGDKDGDSVERLPNGCPVDWRIEQLLPHDSDCNKYFQCTHGVLVERPCPAGLHFNEKKQECDWPADAGCEKDPGSGDKDGDSVERLPNGCPVDWRIEQLLPHDSDCNKYFQCTHGVLVERPCPAGLHFNEKKQECDWPADAGCEKDPGSGDKDGDSVERLPNGCPVDWRIEQLLPHDSDCNKYFQCTHGVLVERPCPAGLHFNEKKQECDWPAGAGCEKDPGSGDKDGDSVERLPNGCPVDWRIEQLLPHDSDCNKYFQCTHGVLVERPCPAGLHFNEKKQECDWPADAGCEKDPGSGDKDGDSVERLPNGCPVDWQIEQLLPHDSDCNKYFQCTHGVLVERPCPAGLHFNEKKQECDWPADAGCEKDPGSGDKDGDSVERLPNGCPVDWRIEQLLPHDSDCNKYFQCTHGVLVERPCPAGLHFNEHKQVCDWPEYAGCKENGSGERPEPPENDKCSKTCNTGHWSHATDCDKFWRCEGGKTVLGFCPEGLHYNEAIQTCDFICNVDCTRHKIQATPSVDGLKIFIPWDKVDKHLLSTYDIQDV